MSAQLSLARYNLTLLVMTPESGVHLQGDVGDFEDAMIDPVLADDGHTILSVRSQLVLALRPPQVVLTDESGAMPTRSAFISASAAIVQMFLERGLLIPGYGWNFQGTIAGLEPEQTMRRLVAEDRILSAIESDVEWKVPQLQISAKSSLADQLNITIQDVSQQADQIGLTFGVNAHFGTSPTLDRLEEQSAELWRASAQLLLGLLTNG